MAEHRSGPRRRPAPGLLAAVALAGLVAVAALAALALHRAGSPPAPPPAAAVESPPSYVGSASCAECHRAETEAWRGSHHDRAIEEATEATVLGDFDGAAFSQGGVTSTFFRRDGRFLVRTDGPDGALHDYEIAYTFGVDPLQQYLIALPDGRLQALGIAWDSRPKTEGGQRWFPLYPDPPPEPADPLHWTGIDQNWNHMCAECHSTNLRKNYVAAESRYETAWSELDVACEGCHGQGSRHLAWARARVDAGGEPSGGESIGPHDRAGKRAGDGEAMGLTVRLDDRDLDAWKMNSETGTVERAAPLPSRRELETCARCHARRGLLDESDRPGQPLLDTHRPALLEQSLYFADGQIRDEVYEYGSFLQSRMHGKGVTCSDCHDPHSLELLAGGDAVCARCHAPDRFAVESHHHHPPATAGARCVSCHMPERTYMRVDPRRDHSLRVPRPDLAAATGAPDACTGCHRDREPAWAARAVEGWLGSRERPPHWGEAIAAAWRGEAAAERSLIDLAGRAETPAIVRGTALSLLRDPAAPASRAALERGLGDADGLVRLGALGALESAGMEERLALLPELLADPALAVRIEAARLLAGAPAERLGSAAATELDAALAEYRATQEIAADRPEAHLNLGNLALAQGDPAAAEAEYRDAIRLDPSFVPAQVNLADVLRATGRDEEAARVLREALARAPEDATLHHSLGLALVRLGRRDEALAELERAAELAPGEPRFAYVLGIALHSAGRRDEALAVLERASRQAPRDADLLHALASIERERSRGAVSTAPLQ